MLFAYQTHLSRPLFCIPTHSGSSFTHFRFRSFFAFASSTFFNLLIFAISSTLFSYRFGPFPASRTHTQTEHRFRTELPVQHSSVLRSFVGRLLRLCRAQCGHFRFIIHPLSAPTQQQSQCSTLNSHVSRSSALFCFKTQQRRMSEVFASRTGQNNSSHLTHSTRPLSSSFVFVSLLDGFLPCFGCLASQQRQKFKLFLCWIEKLFATSTFAHLCTCFRDSFVWTLSRASSAAVQRWK
jgi:hypothetical protein